MNLKELKIHTNLLNACKDFVSGWSHFCDCIDFCKSALDADAIRWMNEVPGKIQTAITGADLPSEPADQAADQVDNAVSDPRLETIHKYIYLLPVAITSREQAIASTNLFTDEIKAELAVALNCSSDEVPGSLADYLGFVERPTEPKNQCQFCGREFETAGILATHIKKKHQN